MNVRPATVADIDWCQRLNSSYATSYIWHLDQTIRPDEIQGRLQRVRVPRPLELQDPRLKEDLFHIWQGSRCFLVAEELGVVLGYLSVSIDPRTWRGSIDHLAVHRPYRRRGIASMLLEAAERWARGSELTSIVAVAQSKNDPAISLFPRCGLSFHGYVDDYFSNGDLGMVYRLSIRERVPRPGAI